MSTHRKLWALCVCFLCSGFNPLLGHASRADRQEIFVSGEGGYHTYRIPSLLTTPQGAVLAFCEGRKNGRGDSGDIDLLVKRSEDGGSTWTPAEVVWQDADNTCGNPCPVIDERTGYIHMLMTWNLGSDGGGALHDGTSQGTRRVFYCRSEDDGRTWSPAVEITARAKDARWWWYATGPGVGIQLKTGPYAGRLVIPCNHTAPEYYYGAHVLYSDDAGETWERSGTIAPSCNESQVVELSDGRLLMNMRSQAKPGSGRERNGYRSVAYSADGGATWSAPEFDPHLGDPICQASLIRYDSNRHLFSNPSPEIQAGRGERKRMTLRMSLDDGETWPHSLLIDEGPSAYSCLARLPNGSIGLLYEAGTSIVLTILPLSSLDQAKVSGLPAEGGSRPNVLFLAVDDLRDWVNCMGGYAGVVHTPNIDRLAAQGMLFTNAHCTSPKCAPSRAAILTGLRPSTTGLYDNGHWWLPNLPQVVTMPKHFQNAGYRVVGSGKIFHHTAGNNPPNQWNDYFNLTFRNDPWFRSDQTNYPWSQSSPNPAGFPFSGVHGLGHENDWGALNIADNEYEDSLSTDYAVHFLENRTSEANSQPFFLACGLFRPHLPWYVPEKYFDLYPLDEVVLPEVKEDDLDDVPAGGRAFAISRQDDFALIRKADKWKHAVRAYLASITFADEQLGRILDALANSLHSQSTIIVLWSDHGWHLGEKQHWHKSTLWEEATRIPLIVSVPGLQPGRCERPVGLIDVYPTLIELAGLDPITPHDGISLCPLLSQPEMPWNRPAVTEFQLGNAAVRTDRYRYIRYRDGGEELYDHERDPREWNNLASSAAHAGIKQELASWLPTHWAEEAAPKRAFDFDPHEFTWKNKKTGEVFRGKDE
jgi:choline-sulfatase